MMFMITKSCLLIRIAVLLSASAVISGQQLKIVAHTRPQGSNAIRLECKETFVNESVATANDITLFLFNNTGERVTSLLDREEIVYEFPSESRILSFEIQQSIEGYYYCSRNHDAGSPPPTPYKTLLAEPRVEEVQTYYERHVGESVTLKSGVGEGALAQHYSAAFYKENVPYTNVSRGDDFSLTLTSLALLDSGIYAPSVRLRTESGEIHLVPSLPRITLTVYQSPIIELPPQSFVANAEKTSVSFTCIVTGGPFLRVSWVREGVNLTKKAPSHYNINETVLNEGTKVVTMVTIHRPNYNESGRFICDASILNGRSGNDFRVQGSADLTVLESEFYLKTLITVHQQIQLWVELKKSISLHPVTAIVYFTLAASPGQRPQPVRTHSIVANTTVMIFQLEPHDVPERFRDQDFYLQVALRVNSVETALVPNSLEMANTANLNKPTESDCGRHKTHQFAIIVCGSVIAGFILLIAVTVIFFCFYKSFKVCQRTCRRLKMPPEERMNLERQNKELVELLKDPTLTGKNLSECVRELIQINKQLLLGDSGEQEHTDGDDAGGNSN